MKPFFSYIFVTQKYTETAPENKMFFLQNIVCFLGPMHHLLCGTFSMIVYVTFFLIRQPHGSWDKIKCEACSNLAHYHGIPQLTALTMKLIPPTVFTMKAMCAPIVLTAPTMKLIPPTVFTMKAMGAIVQTMSAMWYRGYRLAFSFSMSAFYKMALCQWITMELYACG